LPGSRIPGRRDANGLDGMADLDALGAGLVGLAVPQGWEVLAYNLVTQRLLSPADVANAVDNMTSSPAGVAVMLLFFVLGFGGLLAGESLYATISAVSCRPTRRRTSGRLSIDKLGCPEGARGAPALALADLGGRYGKRVPVV
jgi:hypothetical protein